MEVNKELDSDSSKDNLVPGLPTLNKTPKPNYRAPLSLPIDIGESLSLPIDLGESLLPPIESLNALVKKKPHYITVPAKETKLKKKINSNIGE